MAVSPAGSRVRLAELVAVMSLGADLGLGQPMEHVLRQCLIALRLADRLGLDESERGVVYYVSLLAWVGCHVDAYEQAKWFGDDMALKRDARLVDMKRPLPVAAFAAAHVGAGRPMPERARLGIAFLGEGRSAMERMLLNHWFAIDDLAARLGLEPKVRENLYQTFERWDGKGVPGEAKGEGLLVAARLVGLADVVEVFSSGRGRRGGNHRRPGARRHAVRPGGRRTVLRRSAAPSRRPRRCQHLGRGDRRGAWLDSALPDDEVETVLEAIADYTDVKSPYTLGHSRAVAALASDAAGIAGLLESEQMLIRRAALVHDLGRLGVSNAIWDKRGELTPAERERIRLHPYLTERMLAYSPALAPLAALAAEHHERLDGSGYHRGLTGVDLTPASRILAAADTYRAKTEPRPHCSERSHAEAASDLRSKVRAGRLDSDAVSAVLQAAGHPVRHRRDGPAGLTTREIEVLRLLARGLSNKEIAERLVISRKTASHHVEHIYSKIGVSNRALAGLFAVKQRSMMTDF